MLDKLMYSYMLGELSSTVVIDGVAKKYRGVNFDDATEHYIANAKGNFDNVLIQDGKHIEIYSSDRLLDRYLQIIDSLPLKKVIDGRHNRYSNIVVFYEKNGKIMEQMYI